MSTRPRAYFLWGEPQVYRGIRLRSKLELRAVKALELKHKLVLGETLIYEPKNLVVTYKNPATGMPHQYSPDLFDAVHKVVYEVKHIGRAADVIVEIKAEAMRTSFPSFKYVMLTEEDIDTLEREQPHENSSQVSEYSHHQ